MMPQVVELDDVTKVFYKHTNPTSRLGEIGRSQLAQELHETCKLPFAKWEQQNPVRTSNRFLELVMFIPIHTTNLSPNHVF